MIFPVHYIRLFVQKERTKKQRRMDLEKGDLQKELLEEFEKSTPQIIKSSIKSVEMTNMVNNRPIIENELVKEKEIHQNGEHKIGQ